MSSSNIAAKIHERWKSHLGKKAINKQPTNVKARNTAAACVEARALMNLSPTLSLVSTYKTPPKANKSATLTGKEKMPKSGFPIITCNTALKANRGNTLYAKFRFIPCLISTEAILGA